MSRKAGRAEGHEYELLDAGEGRRLERFGDRVVDRPAPMAFGWKSTSGAWTQADLRFDTASGWRGPAEALAPWPVEVADGLTLELRPTDSGGLGMYPEHLANLAWVAEQIRGDVAQRPERRPS